MLRGRRAKCPLSYYTLAVTFVGYRGREKKSKKKFGVQYGKQMKQNSKENCEEVVDTLFTK